MDVETGFFKSFDGKQIYYCKCLPNGEGRPKGVVQIAHGMGEYVERYAPLAKALTKNGFAVYGNDHRGHGNTETQKEKLGYHEQGNFWEKCIKDMHELNLIIQKEQEGLPIFLLGHSMGSQFAREYILIYHKQLAGVVISGTASFQKLLGGIGIIIIRILKFFKGRDKESALLKELLFGEFNRKFKPNRTAFDWLSRDDKQVDMFIADPLRIEKFSIGLVEDLVLGTKKVNRENFYQNSPKSLPMLIFSGENDPVGEMGKGVTKIYNYYRNAGVRNIKLKLYNEGRHEMFNEINREEVFKDLITWLDREIMK